MSDILVCAYDSKDAVCGPVSWLIRLLPQLRANGLQVRCLLLYWDAPGPLTEFLNKNGIECELTKCEGDTEARATWILQQVVCKPPKVFIPNLVVPALFASRWIRHAGIPTLGVLHSDDTFYRAVAEVFASGNSKFALTDLVCVSVELQSKLADQVASRTRLHRIPYGVPIPTTSHSPKKGTFRIAYVGRLVEEQKRIVAVTQALCRIVREIPGTSASLFGSGPDEALVKEVLTQEGAGLDVKLEGRVEATAIQSLLQNFDAILLLSDYEGLPIAILEAMACGVIPVCKRIQSGIPELVEHNVTGLIVEDREQAVVDAFRRLASDPELCRNLSRAARSRVIAEFSETVCVQKWTTLLKQLSASAIVHGQIVIPSNWDLPPVHPALAAEDPRRRVVPFWERCCQGLRIFAGRIRRLARRVLIGRSQR